MAVGKQLSDSAGRSGIVHQVLHGYRDGHRLLSSSIPLPQSALDAMLSLTDAIDVYDDPAMAELVAIYPLPDTDLIAASLTWPATEVGRPGAVWTHTLIADSSTLGAAGPALVTLFRRPMSATRRELEQHYGTSLRVGLADREGVLPEALDVAARIAWALHETPARPVIAEATMLGPDARHRLVIGLATQCWPTLSAKLTCGEAASVPRHLGSRPFELTLTGRRGMSALTRGLVEPPRLMPALTKVEPPQWAVLLASDAYRPDGLTDFLRRFGPAANADRAAVKPLAQVYTQLSGETGLVEALPGVLKVLASAFSRRSDMAELKVAIFGAPQDRRLTSGLRETDILAILARDPHARCLSTVDLQLAERAAALASSSSDEAVALLRVVTGRDKTTDAARALCAGLATGISPRGLRDLSRKHPDLVASLLDIHPATIERPELWAGSPTALLEVLDGRVRDPARRRIIAMHAARIADRGRAETLIERWPREIEEATSAILAVPAALDVWAEVLPTQTLAAWLAAQPQPSAVQVLKVASRLTASQASLVPADMWLRARSTVGTAPFDERGFATLLCVAVRLDNMAAADLACEATDRLWGAIANDDLERTDVRLDLSRLGKRGTERDIADGVIQRIVRSFSKRSWHAEAALLLRNLDTFERLLETDAAAHPAGSIAQRLLSHLSPDASAEQVAVMEAVVKRHAPREDLVHILEGFVRRLTPGL